LFRTAGLACGIALLAVAGWAVFGAGAAPGPVLATLAVLALVKGLARYLEQYCGHYVAFRALARLRLYFYDQLAPQAPAAVEGRDTGDLLARATKDVDRVEVFFAHTIAPAVTAVLVPVGTVVWTAAVLGPAAAAPLALGLALVGLATPALGSRLSAEGAAQVRAARGRIAGHVRDSVQGVREVLAFGYQDRRLAELDRAGRPLAAGMAALGRVGAARRAANVGLIGLTLVAELLVGAAAGLDAPDFGLLLGLTAAGFGPVLGVEDFAADLQQAYASARRIFEVTDAAPAVADRAAEADAGGSGLPAAPAWPHAPGPAAGAAWPHAPGPAAGLGAAGAPEVRFEAVGFGYPGAARSSPALVDVSLTAAAGRVTAIVGASGSGKSTLAALLTRSWDPDSGAIYLGGRRLDQYPLGQLRSLVGVSAQRPYLFNLSIGDNLRLARPGASEAELDRAASAANFDQVVAGRDLGWQAPVGEMGELLSGGQRQRLALARTLLRDPAVLVLDEATSQLDAAAEADVLRRLADSWRGKTVIVIAHRLATVKAADRIYVMDGGRVVQAGGYGELAAAPGPFADLLAREDH
ncbi:MAG: ABC transporter ATP-binding protein/permease, partial [Bifidobacteriaceae bacterium]|jgi:ABC-type multidrug transport system fused ATPase/permease subunit|nr:ABC transporter ATP-binding protein/permease [Bifidobacteriaceae bacterium]